MHTEIAALTGVETNDNVHHVYSLAICASVSILRQQAVHFEIRSVSLFRALHPFWSGTSSSRAATNCVERSFSPARLPNVLHEGFFGRVQAPRTRAGCIHTYALSLLFLTLQFGPPRSPRRPGLLAHFQKWQASASSHAAKTPFWWPICGQNSALAAVLRPKLRSGGRFAAKTPVKRVPGAPPGAPKGPGDAQEPNRLQKHSKRPFFRRVPGAPRRRPKRAPCG